MFFDLGYTFGGLLQYGASARFESAPLRGGVGFGLQ
jgi:hypothetical protein